MTLVPERPRLDPDVPRPHRWSHDLYERAIEAGLFGDRRIQLLHGELFQMPPMNAQHILASGYLERRFAGLRSDADDRVRVAKPIILPSDGEPEPDLAVLRPGAPAKPHVDDVLLVIEISPATRRKDLGDKLDDYLAAGLYEIWVIDLVGQQAHVFRGGDIVELHHRGKASRLVAERVPEVAIDLDGLFDAALGQATT